MVLKVNDEQLLEVLQRHGGSAAAAAKELNIDTRGVIRRIKRIEDRGQKISSSHPLSPRFLITEHSPRVEANLENGIILVGSDAHYWPGVVSSAHKAFVKLIKDLKPQIVVMNGDAFDGATISRHPRINWEHRPTVKQELEAVTDRLHEITSASKSATYWWCLGNHDQRFETFLSANAAPFEGVKGFRLPDHFPEWHFTMSLFVNKNLMIKHRYRNGTHATWNNTLHGGVSMCTGHLHRLQATIMSDYNGTRWGIDTGTLADVHGQHMNYSEDDPKNHCSGFAVLTIKDGKILYPEFCFVIDGVPYFRGSVLDIGGS